MLSSRLQKNQGFLSFLFGGKNHQAANEVKIKPETLIRLQELCAKHTFVNVNFTDRINCSFQSLILRVEPKNQSMLIDEFFPLQPDMAIMPGESIEITSIGKGLPIKFSSSIGAIEMLDGSPAYRIALPSKVKANQRRDFFRINVDRDMETRLRINLAGGDIAYCDIINLSSSGIGFRVDKNLSEQLSANRLLKNATLTLPDHGVISCDLEVKSYEYRKPPHRCTVVGARFLAMPRTSQKQLDKLMITLQREVKKTA